MQPVKKIGYLVPATVLGTDEQGRTLVRCPSLGCGDPAVIQDDGRVTCPSCTPLAELVTGLLDAAHRDLTGGQGAVLDGTHETPISG